MPTNSLYTLKEIEKYCSAKNEAHLILDTNVLLLFLVGCYDLDYISECPLMNSGRRAYTEEDFKLIDKIIKRFPNKLVITQHVISEVNMLSRNHIKPESRMKEYFQNLIKRLEECKEFWIPLKVLLNSGGVLEFGITDISLIEIARENKFLILTDDAPLYRSFSGMGFVINFETIRANELLN